MSQVVLSAKADVLLPVSSLTRAVRGKQLPDACVQTLKAKWTVGGGKHVAQRGVQVSRGTGGRRRSRRLAREEGHARCRLASMDSFQHSGAPMPSGQQRVARRTAVSSGLESCERCCAHNCHHTSRLHLRSHHTAEAMPQSPSAIRRLHAAPHTIAFCRLSLASLRVMVEDAPYVLMSRPSERSRRSYIGCSLSCVDRASELAPRMARRRASNRHLAAQEAMLAPMQALRLQSAPRVSRRSQSVRASAEAAPATAFSPPALDPNTPSPIFGGSTGGLLRKAQVRGGAARGRAGRPGAWHSYPARARPIRTPPHGVAGLPAASLGAASVQSEQR